MLLRQATKAYTVINKRDPVSSKLEGEDHLKVIPNLHTFSMPCTCLHSHRVYTPVCAFTSGGVTFIQFCLFFGIYTTHLEGKKLIKLLSLLPNLNLWECSFDTCTLASLNLKLKVSHVYFLPDSDIVQTQLFPGPDLQEEDEIPDPL